MSTRVDAARRVLDNGVGAELIRVLELVLNDLGHTVGRDLKVLCQHNLFEGPTLRKGKDRAKGGKGFVRLLLLDLDRVRLHDELLVGRVGKNVDRKASEASEDRAAINDTDFVRGCDRGDQLFEGDLQDGGLAHGDAGEGGW